MTTPLRKIGYQIEAYLFNRAIIACWAAHWRYRFCWFCWCSKVLLSSWLTTYSRSLMRERRITSTLVMLNASAT